MLKMALNQPNSKRQLIVLMKAEEVIDHLVEQGKLKDWEVSQATKLFETFDLLSQAVNSTSRLSPEVTATIYKQAMGHPTLEQSGIRLLLGILEATAEDQGYRGDRNAASRDICQLLVKLFQQEKGDGSKPSQWLPSI